MSRSTESLTLLSRVLGPSDRILLLKDILNLGVEKAASINLDQVFKSFPSICMAEGRVGDDGKISNSATLSSWDYSMPDGSNAIVNLFQEGPYIHVNSDKIKPIDQWVVKRLYEDGNILVALDVKKDRFFSKRFYKVYEIINSNNYKPSLCYS